MKISVVILTYNRNVLLRKCLDSLVLRQSRPPNEVVIVNAGGQDADALVAGYRKDGINVKVVKTRNEGLSLNRNKGVAASAHELVAFTDDDCIVNERWVETFLAAFAEGGKVGSVGGRMFDANRDFLVHHIDEIGLLTEDYYARKLSPHCPYFCTRNVCYAREAMRSAGFFDEGLKTAEDLMMGLSLLKAGYENRYAPEASVSHFGRSTVTQLAKRLFAYGFDTYKVMRKFPDMPISYVLKARRSLPYLVLSTFAGPVRDLVRFGKGRNFLALYLSSLAFKACVNAGMFYGRITKKCA